MSISAMKQALEALENVRIEYDFHGNPADEENKMIEPAITALRQAIAEAEKQEPVTVKHMMDWVYQLKRFSNDGRYMNIPSGLSAGACYELAVEIEQFIKTEPVHAIDISQERVDETAKREHEPFIYVREDNERPFGGYEHCSEADAGAFPVYTAPMIYTPRPKREWVGLTDEDYDELLTGDWGGSLIKAVEAKLKERNGG